MQRDPSGWNLVLVPVQLVGSIIVVRWEVRWIRALWRRRA